MAYGGTPQWRMREAARARAAAKAMASSAAAEQYGDVRAEKRKGFLIGFQLLISLVWAWAPFLEDLGLPNSDICINFAAMH